MARYIIHTFIIVMNINVLYGKTLHFLNDFPINTSIESGDVLIFSNIFLPFSPIFRVFSIAKSWRSSYLPGWVSFLETPRPVFIRRWLASWTLRGCKPMRHRFRAFGLGGLKVLKAPNVWWCPSSLAKLVQITPISLWFVADITN